MPHIPACYILCNNNWPSRILYSENGNSTLRNCKFFMLKKLKFCTQRLKFLHSENASFGVKN